MLYNLRKQPIFCDMSLASLREWTSEEQAWKFHTDDAPGLSESYDVDG